MRAYDYSPEAYEAHLAKQSRIAKWSAKSFLAGCAKPFKPTEDEIARLKASGFYKADRKQYTGPDRPPSPGGAPQQSLPHGRGSYQVQVIGRPHPTRSATIGGSSTTSAGMYPSSGQQSPIVIPPGHTAHIPVYNPATGQYQKFYSPSSKGRHSSKSSSHRSLSPSRSGRSGSSSAQPKPSRSATMPVGYVYPNPYAQQPLNSGSTVASKSSGSMGYTAYHGGTVIVAQVEGDMGEDQPWFVWHIPDVTLLHRHGPSGAVALAHYLVRGLRICRIT